MEQSLSVSMCVYVCDGEGLGEKMVELLDDEVKTIFFGIDLRESNVERIFHVLRFFSHCQEEFSPISM